MPFRKLSELKGPGLLYSVIAGSFLPNGAGVIATKLGAGFTVSRTAVGVYRVVLDAPFADVVAVVLTPKFATAEAGKHLVVEGDYSIPGRWFEIIHKASVNSTTTDFANADISALASSRIGFIAVVATADVAGAGV
jgi:hypothetical protein